MIYAETEEGKALQRTGCRKFFEGAEPQRAIFSRLDAWELRVHEG